MEAVELRQAPFCLWIQDLSVKTLFCAALGNGSDDVFPTETQPHAARPYAGEDDADDANLFTFLFVFFPAGLVLYWVVNNSLSILQQYVITKQIEKSNK